MHFTKTKENFADSIEIHYLETFDNIEMKTHFHNSYEVIYIVEGGAEFKINNKNYTVSKDSIIFISNLESHELRVLEHPYKRYFILVKPDHFQSLINQPVLASIFKHRPSHFAHVINLNTCLKNGLESIIKSMYEEYTKKEDFWDTILASNLNMFFIQLYRMHKEFFPLSTLNRSTSTVLEVQKYIDENFTESISLAGVSKLFYTDFYYLSHLFKKVTGYSFKDYLILLRISKAKDLLFYTAENVTSIALSSGFGNVNHFIRIFKKFEGITPYQYRKLHIKL